MAAFFKSIPGKICIIALSVLLLVVLGLCGYTFWHYQLAKFQDVTIELGDALPPTSAFLTENADPANVRMITPAEQIDLTRAGEQTLVFTHGIKTESITLTIADTIPPTAKFRDLIADLDTPLTAQDFVEEVYDLSQTTVAFATEPVTPENYGDKVIELVVTDDSGNQTTGTAVIQYTWMYPAFTLELGDTVEKTDILLNSQRDGDKVEQVVLDMINSTGVGTYTVTGMHENQVFECVVTVQDTTGPSMVLRALTIDQNEPVPVEDFIEETSDISGEVTTSLLSKPDSTKPGVQEVQIEAVDIHGNKTTLSTTLTVIPDEIAPVFSGMEDMKAEKYAAIDYETGVTATDDKDGEVAFTYDDSRVDVTAPGTYFVVYTASDTKGNTATFRRKVEVGQDDSDTLALVQAVAEDLVDSPEAIRDYVRSRIGYSSSWGGSDPVWYGLRYRVGNCYVHAVCLDALLREKGFDTQLIWCEDKSHYWNIVYINGSWKHIDSTPSDHTHNKYSLMSDEQRHETLEGRDWNREAWPPCP